MAPGERVQEQLGVENFSGFHIVASMRSCAVFRAHSMLLLSALAFFFLITGLILIHELGHFLVARKSGVTVEEFGFGLPPRAKTFFTWKGTAFTLNWIPFGGFVRLKGEGDEAKGKGTFASAPLLSRCLILVAGVGMNFVLAFGIFVFGFSAGRWIPTYPTEAAMKAAIDRGEITMSADHVVLIAQVLPGGGAAKAGIPAGSVLLSVDGKDVTRGEDVAANQKGKTTVRYVYRTGKESGESHEADVTLERGLAGVELNSLPRAVSAPLRNPLAAAAIAARETWVVTGQTVYGIVMLFGSLAQTGRVPEGVTGIVGIAQLTNTAVHAGFMVYLRLVALLSLSLAVLNILPFPALDGGRLMFVLAEVIFRIKDRRIEMVSNTVGFVLLLLVILLVTFYDVLRLFR